MSSVQKKGYPLRNKDQGGGVTQNFTLSQLEEHLGLTAKGTAEVMGVSYNTLKEWKGDRRKMTGPTRKLIEILIAIKGTSIGREFGV